MKKILLLIITLTFGCSASSVKDLKENSTLKFSENTNVNYQNVINIVDKMALECTGLTFNCVIYNELGEGHCSFEGSGSIAMRIEASALADNSTHVEAYTYYGIGNFKRHMDFFKNAARGIAACP